MANENTMDEWAKQIQSIKQLLSIKGPISKGHISAIPDDAIKNDINGIMDSVINPPNYIKDEIKYIPGPVYPTIKINIAQYYASVEDELVSIMSKLVKLSDTLIEETFKDSQKKFLKENGVFYTTDGFLNIVRLTNYERTRFINSPDAKFDEDFYIHYMIDNYRAYYDLLTIVAFIFQGVLMISSYDELKYNAVHIADCIRHIMSAFKKFPDDSITSSIKQLFHARLMLGDGVGEYTEESLQALEICFRECMERSNKLYKSIKNGSFKAPPVQF